MFDWTDARIFLVVCAKNSFTAAAKELALDQTTVGRRMAALEASLHTKLFRRGPSGLSLTSAGEEARAIAEQMESAANSLDRRLRGRDRSAEGTVHITTIESFARGFIAPRLGAFHSAHPRIKLTIKTDNRALSLARREADLAIRHWKPSQPGLVVRKIGQVAFALYASPSYVAQRSITDGPDRYIGFEDDLGTIPESKWLSARSGGEYALRSNSRSVLESAAAGGLGIALLPCYLAARRDDLVRVDEAEAPLVRDLWLIVHAELVEQAVVRAVTEFVVAEASRAKDTLLGHHRRGGPPRKERNP